LLNIFAQNEEFCAKSVIFTEVKDFLWNFM